MHTLSHDFKGWTDRNQSIPLAGSIPLTSPNVFIQLQNFVVFYSSHWTPDSLDWIMITSFFLHLLQIMLGFGRLQALYRSRQLAKQYETTRAHIIRFQAACRGYLIRQKVAAQMEAVCVIHRHIQGACLLARLHRGWRGGYTYVSRYFVNMTLFLWGSEAWWPLSVAIA